MIKVRIDGREMHFFDDEAGFLTQEIVLRPGGEPEYWIIDIPAYTGLTMAEIQSVMKTLAVAANIQITLNNTKE